MSDERDRKLVERYDAHAITYRELWAPTLRLASLKLFGALAGQRVRRVLDIGTGVGALWSDLRAIFPGAWLLGFDRSPGMLKLAPKPLARVIRTRWRRSSAPAASIASKPGWRIS